MCAECEHSFTGCQTCLIVDSTGSREIATIERRVTGEFDQTPASWRCNPCGRINAFDNELTLNGFLAPKIRAYRKGMRCGRCDKPFTEDSWVISPFSLYLGTWNGKIVAEGGPWHWNLDWHRDFARDDHSKDDCYATRPNGRRRRENPCIIKHSSPQRAAKRFRVPALFVDVHDDHSLPPCSAGLTPFYDTPHRGTHDQMDDGRSVDPELLHETWTTRDRQTLDSAGFTVEYYRYDDPEDDGQQQASYEELDLGSYYDPPGTDDGQPYRQRHKRYQPLRAGPAHDTKAYKYPNDYLEDGSSQGFHSESSLLNAYLSR
ncbi:hypothetical protein MMYC01_203773 [Madurella mycetomatis]|uniref:Uncharacterized protein n=1 Tax=Madurella mycetomatis TaxID=100816 RepID=A0A175W815_9PEZI|nr:hypothetical protein MMYC01_203773 [Madurella mycetomatis]